MRSKLFDNSFRGSYLGIICLSIMIINSIGIAKEIGEISGTVFNAETGEPLEKINVSIKGTTMGAATNSDGKYIITRVPTGSYTLVFSAVGFVNLEFTNVTVTAGESTTLDAFLLEEVVELGDVLVYGASKHPERITKAPSAISTISAIEVRRVASTGQVPRLFEAEPGIDVVQNGINDYNLNARGFNSSLNRRVLVLLDNRETSIAFLGAQEWNSLSFPLEDLGRLELVRGPGSALYGANAYSGVINITTPAPKDILGTKVSISGGELNSFKGDVRHAGFSGPWSYKFNIGSTRNDTWSKSRTNKEDLEYAGLDTEVVTLNDEDLSTSYGSARVDYDFINGGVFTLEGGFAQAQDQVYVTGLGRVQVDKVNKPWGRATYASDRFFLQADYSGRKTQGNQQVSLNSGAVFKEDSYNLNFQFQHNLSALEKRIRFFWGASQRFQHVDTDKTLTPDTYHENQTGLFAQLELQLSDKITLVGATRVDRSTLHDTQFSPKAAVVFLPRANHSFRATFNRAFQTPNYSEFFLRAPAGTPVPLDSLELGLEATLGQDLPLNFGPTPVLALGNEDLKVEKIFGYEFGYKGIYSKKFSVTANIYFNRLNNFITDLLPRVNPTFAPYQLPGDIPEPIKRIINNTLEKKLGNNLLALSTLPDGSLAFVVSYTNAGKVNEWGFELGLNYYVTNEILLSGNWTYFDFDVIDQAVGDVLIPNTPQNKFNIGLSYNGPQGLDFGIRIKYIQGFDWAAGVFQGKVPKYTLVNLAGGYKIKSNIRLGLVITNLLANEHYELFGGSVNGRRALGSITVDF
ncbi:MAG: TonB-dependent receptor domain-containing protein [bacterium]